MLLQSMKLRVVYQLATLLLLFGFLSGCALLQNILNPATDKKPDKHLLWQKNLAKLLPLHNWKIAGRMASKQGKKGSSSSFVWQQNREKFNLNFAGLLGYGAMQINGKKQHATITYSNGEKFTTDNLTTTLQETAKINIPIDSLRYWVRGMPDIVDEYRYKLDEQGRLYKLHQHGWIASYSSYQQIAGAWLPKKIKLERDDSKLIVAITQWQM